MATPSPAALEAAPNPDEVVAFEQNAARAVADLDQRIANSEQGMAQMWVEGREELLRDVAEIRARHGLPTPPGQ